MALPEWLNQRRDEHEVSNEDVLLALPELSDEDWARGADRYLREASQLAFFLQVQASEAERTLDEASRCIREGRKREAEPLIRDVLFQIQHSKQPHDCRAWARIAMTGSLLADKGLGEAATHQGVSMLRDIGLVDVATMVGRYEEISTAYGVDVAEVFAEGLLSKVDGWCVERELSATYGDKTPGSRGVPDQHTHR